jgi:hypothetical protein
MNSSPRFPIARRNTQSKRLSGSKLGLVAQIEGPIFHLFFILSPFNALSSLSSSYSSLRQAFSTELQIMRRFLHAEHVPALFQRLPAQESRTITLGTKHRDVDSQMSWTKVWRNGTRGVVSRQATPNGGNSRFR